MLSAESGGLCSQYEGSLWARSEIRLLGLTFSSIKLLHLRVPAVLPSEQKHAKLPPKVNAGILGHTPTESGHYQRHVLHSTTPGQPHVPARAAQAVDEACITQFAPPMLIIIREPRERCQTISKNHSFKSYFGDKTNKITAAEHLKGHSCLPFLLQSLFMEEGKKVCIRCRVGKYFTF